VTSTRITLRRSDPDRLAAIELEAWKAYYRREGPRLFRLLIRANREQGRSRLDSGDPRRVLARLGRGPVWPIDR
jgi:hypothetical protein